MHIRYRCVKSDQKEKMNSMSEYAEFITSQICLLILGMIFSIILPVVFTAVWMKKKNEDLTAILIGAAVFLVFIVILADPIKNILVYPSGMGLMDHAVSRFINEKPVLWAFVIALLPGFLGETGRFAAFKTVLKSRKNRETSISFGIGYGGFEIMFVLGFSFLVFLASTVMYNTGVLSNIVIQMMGQASAKSASVFALEEQVVEFSFADLALIMVDRIFTVVFHIGASIMVFYACRDEKKFWLYPMAILLHTARIFIESMTLTELVHLPEWLDAGLSWIFGVLTFCGAYVLLYKKDADRQAQPNLFTGTDAACIPRASSRTSPGKRGRSNCCSHIRYVL